MRTIKTDNKRVIAKNATLLGFATREVKRGSFFIYNDAGQFRMARSLGRIAECDSDGEDCTGHVLAMIWGMSGYCYERWVNPTEIVECLEKPPTQMAAFFFAEELPYDAHTMRRLMAHGTLSEQFVENHAARVAMFEARLAAAAA